MLVDALEATLLVMKKTERCTQMTKHTRKEYAAWILQYGVRRQLMFIVNLDIKKLEEELFWKQRAAGIIDEEDYATGG